MPFVWVEPAVFTVALRFTWFCETIFSVHWTFDEGCFPPFSGPSSSFYTRSTFQKTWLVVCSPEISSLWWFKGTAAIPVFVTKYSQINKNAKHLCRRLRGLNMLIVTCKRKRHQNIDILRCKSIWIIYLFFLLHMHKRHTEQKAQLN